MVINFHECSSYFDKGSILILVLAIVVLAISGLKVYNSESEEFKEKSILRELLGGLEVFFTSKYLDKEDKKWHRAFIISISYILSWWFYAAWIMNC